jgi:hypothetical protein
MEHNFSIVSNEYKISLINDKINILLQRKADIEPDIQRVLDNPSMDRITIDKIQAEINDINSIIEALQAELPSQNR